MKLLQSIPPDQRAVLQLVLRQGRSYDDIARLLKIDRDAVRERARNGLEALGPDVGRRLTPERRAEVADYLLGQQSASEQAATMQLLAGSAGGRAWARVVADELRPLARSELPEIPAGGEPAPPAAAESDGAPAGDQRPPRRPRLRRPAPRPAPVPPAGPVGDEPGPVAGSADEPPSSRLGGALLLLGLAILVAVAIVVLVTRGSTKSSHPKATASTPAATQSTPTQSTPAQTPVPQKQINLTAAQSGSKAKGVAVLSTQNGQSGLVIAAENVPPNHGDFYAVWLYNSQSSAKLLGFQQVGANGRFSAVAPAPSDLSSYKQLIITREQPNKARTAPTKPGPIVLQGALS